MKRPILLFTSFALILAAGCAHEDDEEAVVTASTSSALQASSNGGVGGIALDGLDRASSADARGACAALAATPPLALYPAGCATRTCVDDRLHIELHECTGPLGRRALTGGLDATFSRTEAGLTVAVADDGTLTAGGRPFDFAATGTVKDVGDPIDATWHTHSVGTTPRGRTIDSESDLSIQQTRGTGCLAVAGTKHAQVGPVQVKGTIDGLAMCPGRCPTSGTIHLDKSGPRRDRTVDITFDGTATAHVKSSVRGSYDVALVCDPEDAADQ